MALNNQEFGNIGLIVAVLAVLLSTIGFLLIGRKSKIGVFSGTGGGRSEKKISNKKPTLFIAGPSNSGKTALFHWLTTETFKTTVISQFPNTCEDFKLSSDDKSVSLIEFPGNFKLRYKLLDSLRNSTNIKGIVFLVDSTVDPKQLVETAEFLYQILNITENRKHNGVDILIACNKSESFTARPPQKIKTVLETEITDIIKRKKQSLGSVKKTADSNVDDDEDDEMENENILDSMKDFKFSALEGEVDVIEGSVLKQKLSKWQEWMHEVINK
ncbi:hypothetical protein Kpol_1032p92 [Vanderwaltozyma polyspora DSM 70294]|uniref:Signal recognition particle receptor subunit beta n=1 Tax=Vanderwaltozyma polyspora (strain ATCC 22028 / DSM 70294 / BCRC 21397 / CBS 2163 / NBRC 10782 / NRRL Y-8283 / UCD 57-17) TaxID=436907 RepID=A7TH43_VANPO|nr:uncharacterized protein Kpol_1032p92 [Vanderwaltozyma polyspora DSM 70294]EDO18495.1 hypothetical protein Kpol_1032p92 [Vanderwaltozyma polyspora DSM 70294]